jgi:hypothetical protein
VADEVDLPIDKEEAALAYGVRVDSLPDEVVYLEEWTEREYQVSVGGKVLTQYSGKNPWGRVPMVYLPRVRAEGFYGLALYEDIKGAQDELNARLADVGDNVNNAAHPIRWIRNYRGDPNRDFVVGADQLWDLGSNVSGQEPPEVGVIPAQPEPSSTFHFVNFLLDMTRQSSFTSPVAFGEDEGSHRSGVTLTLRLWPLLQQVKTTRIYWRTMLVMLNNMVLHMASQRDIEGAYEATLAQHAVLPNFSDLVPQDRQLLIDEIVRRAEADLISPEEAVARFGVKAGTEQEELERIKRWMAFKAEKQAAAQLRGGNGESQGEATPDKAGPDGESTKSGA